MSGRSAGQRPIDRDIPLAGALTVAGPDSGLPPGLTVPGTMGASVELARRVASSSAYVLVTGESGTGKEVISRIIHQCSPRASRSMVCVNCAALPESLIESELFGHRRGAFTGAEQDRVGSFELSSGSTLLLDEISEIPVSLQAKLLRVLELRELQRVGSNESIAVDLRVIATSNRPLEAEVQAGRFRLDLYHRLNLIQIHLTPLRERPEDIRPLAAFFAANCPDLGERRLMRLDRTALQRLERHSWPGNVRELKNVIHRACILTDGEVIRAGDLGDFDQTTATVAEPRHALAAMTLEELERWAIQQALERFRGNRVAAARHLGITPRTIFNKLRDQQNSAQEEPNPILPFRYDESAMRPGADSRSA